MVFRINWLKYLCQFSQSNGLSIKPKVARKKSDQSYDSFKNTTGPEYRHENKSYSKHTDNQKTNNYEHEGRRNERY